MCVCACAHICTDTSLNFSTVHPIMDTCSALCNSVWLWCGSAVHSHAHTQRNGNRFLWQVASLSKSFPIKEKKCEILVGLKVLLHEEKKFTKSIVFHLFSHFLMNKYYPLKTFKKVLRYTVLYFCFLYWLSCCHDDYFPRASAGDFCPVPWHNTLSMQVFPLTSLFLPFLILPQSTAWMRVWRKLPR